MAVHAMTSTIINICLQMWQICSTVLYRSLFLQIDLQAVEEGEGPSKGGYVVPHSHHHLDTIPRLLLLLQLNI